MRGSIERRVIGGARPPLPMGTHGSIEVVRRAGDITGSYVAMCRFRDFDGRTRLIERSGATKAAASRALQDEIRTRSRSVATAPLRPGTRSSGRPRCGVDAHLTVERGPVPSGPSPASSRTRQATSASMSRAVPS
ncbi:hypothetical protein GCM10009772_19630 [Pseudonocardia alni subsp. carboxydivorans]